MAATLSFVILSWNSAATIEECLRSIRRACLEDEITYEVLIVDNGSRDDTVACIERHHETMPITLISMERNLGTTRTRNLALRRVQGEIICVMDSDASFISGSLRAVIDELKTNKRIGVLAPRLIEKNGRVQVSVKRFPTILGKIARIPRIVLRLPLTEGDRYQTFPFEQTTEVDCAISACWFFNRNMLDEVGYLDERIFYAPEDVDYCIRSWKCGRAVVYYPHMSVFHRTQRITHKRFLSGIALSHLTGLLYYFFKHRYLSSPDIPPVMKTASYERMIRLCFCAG